MARQFAALGHDLALCARPTERLDELRAEILAVEPSRRVEVRALDVTDDDAVFAVFRAFAAGLRHHRPGGRERRHRQGCAAGDRSLYAANRATAMTNFVAALAQTEAAMEIFRAPNSGHLVMMSSISAMRGMPRSMATYAATKAAVAHLAEGLRYELHGKPIKVTRDLSGLHRLGDERRSPDPPMMVSTEKGVRAHRRRDREGEGLRPSAHAPLGAARHGDPARAAAVS